jgi:hypothetical protein
MILLIGRARCAPCSSPAFNLARISYDMGKGANLALRTILRTTRPTQLIHMRILWWAVPLPKGGPITVHARHKARVIEDAGVNQGAGE